AAGRGSPPRLLPRSPQAHAKLPCPRLDCCKDGNGLAQRPQSGKTVAPRAPGPLSQDQNGACAPLDSACAATPCNVLPPQVCSRMGSAMQRKVMISCAVTGSADTPGRTPAVPATPTPIAQSALDAAKAGAASAPVRDRRPNTP